MDAAVDAFAATNFEFLAMLATPGESAGAPTTAHAAAYAACKAKMHTNPEFYGRMLIALLQP
jgi:hypothetical protein